jgi:hypothetical protein
LIEAEDEIVINRYLSELSLFVVNKIVSSATVPDLYTSDCSDLPFRTIAGKIKIAEMSEFQRFS